MILGYLLRFDCFEMFFVSLCIFCRGKILLQCVKIVFVKKNFENYSFIVMYYF